MKNMMAVVLSAAAVIAHPVRGQGTGWTADLVPIERAIGRSEDRGARFLGDCRNDGKGEQGERHDPTT